MWHWVPESKDVLHFFTDKLITNSSHPLDNAPTTNVAFCRMLCHLDNPKITINLFDLRR